jgi:hypothetical protein
MTNDFESIDRVAREVLALGRDEARIVALLAELGDDHELVGAVTARLANITSRLAELAAQLAAEAVARGVDGEAVTAQEGAPEAVLELVYRAIAAERAS